jgi:hypothetical protein
MKDFATLVFSTGEISPFHSSNRAVKTCYRLVTPVERFGCDLQMSSRSISP